MAKDLTAKASIATTDFGKGVQEIRDKLSSLNTSLEENKQALKAAAKEANGLLKEQQKLAEEMKKDGGTDEQKQDMQQLSDKIAQVNAKIGSLRAAEGELKSAVRVTNKELEEQISGVSEQKQKMQELSEKLVHAKEKEEQLRAKLSDTNKELKEQKTATGDVRNSLGDLGSVIKTVIATVATKTLYEWLFGSNAEMEQYLTSFTVMLGDAEKAKKLMDELTNFAATTPLEMTDVISASEMLMNYGIAADEVIEKMTQLGDLSSGNAAKLDRVTLAYGQMLAKGKVTNEELRQMLEAGVPLLQALADTMGITTAEVQDLASKSKIGIEELDAAIDSLTTDGGQFAGMMEQQSLTFEGMLSNAKDTIAQIGRGIGEDAFEELKTALSDILGKVQELEKDGTLKKWCSEAADLVTDVTEAFVGFTGCVLDHKEAVLAAVTAFATFKAACAIGNVVSATAAAVQTFTNATKRAEMAQAAFNAVGAANPYVLIASLIAGVVGALVSFVSTAETAADRMNKMHTEALQLIDDAEEYQKKSDGLKNVSDRYMEIYTSEKSAEEKGEELKNLQDDLIDQYGAQAAGIDLVNGSYSEQLGLIDQLITKNKELAIANAQSALAAAEEAENEVAYTGIDSSAIRSISNNSDYDYEKRNGIWDYIYDLDTFNSQGFTGDVALSGTYEERAADYEKLYHYLVDEVGASQSDETVKKVLEQWNEMTEKAEEKADLENRVAELTKEPEPEPFVTATAKEAEQKGKAENVKKITQDFEPDEDKFDEELSNLNFDHEMDRISDDEYYSRWEELVDKYLESDSDKWRDNTQKIYKGRKSLNKSTSSSSTSTLPEEYTSAKKTLKYKYDMGEIDSKKYYEEVYKLMREHGISEDCDEWRGVDVEKKNYNDNQAKTTSTGADKAVSETETMMKTLSNAFSEQKENGTLSASTVEKLIELGYEEALAIDEVTGAITLKTNKTKELFDEQVETAQTALDNEEKELEANGKSTAGIKAKSTALKNLAKEYSNVEKGIYGASAAEKSYYSDINKAFKEASDKRIKQIDKELEAKKKAANEAIEAIEEEVEARKRAKEDDDIQSEIDSISAQLKYAQLDGFSRAQLERKLSSLYDEQADLQWERSTQDRKDAINGALDADEKATKAEKEAIDEATTTVTNALNDVANGIELSAARISAAVSALQAVFENLSAGSAGSIPNITNNITTNGGETTNNNSFTIGTENYTAEQIVQIIYEALGNPTI